MDTDFGDPSEKAPNILGRPTSLAYFTRLRRRIEAEKVVVMILFFHDILHDMHCLRRWFSVNLCLDLSKKQSLL